MTRRAEITVTINDQTVMSWFSLIVKDVARGVEPPVMWWLLEGIEPSSDSRLSPVARLGGAAVERNGRKNDHLEPLPKLLDETFFEARVPPFHCSILCLDSIPGHRQQVKRGCH